MRWWKSIVQWIKYDGWQFEVFDDGPVIGYFPPQPHPFEPNSAVWASYVVYPRPPETAA